MRYLFGEQTNQPDYRLRSARSLPGGNERSSPQLCHAPPEAPNIDFVRGWTPSYAKDPTLGGVVYQDTSDGRTISFLASTDSPWANKYGCKSLLGTVVSTPKGLSVCLQEPKQGVETITIIDSTYEHDGVYYQMHMDDHRPASRAMSAQDQAWMLDLIDSYQ